MAGEFRSRQRVDSKRYLRWLTHEAQRQTEFAMVMALTWTARDARQEVQAELPKVFTLRNRHAQRGIRFRPATKANPTSEVGSVDWFMADHETGGIRRPRGGRHIAVPSRQLRRTKTGRISKANRPRALRSKANVFVETAGRRGGVIYRRSRSRVQALWFLVRRIRIRRNPWLVPVAERTAERRLDRNFVKAMQRALRPPRR